MSEFKGGLFTKAVADGRASATLSVLAEGVAARTPEEQLFLLPYEACQIEVGGNSGRMVFCRRSRERAAQALPPGSELAPCPDDLTIFCEEPGFLEALNAGSRGLFGERILRLQEREQRAGRRRLLLGVSAVVLLSGLAVGAYFGIRHTARAAVTALPVSVDEKIGGMALQSMDLQGPRLEDAKVTAAIQAMVARLDQQVAEPFEFRVQVIDAPIVNAFALPGGHIVVYTGLLKKAERPEQVAGVLAHEMAHVVDRHGLQRVSQSVGLVAGINLLLGDVSSLVALGVELVKEVALSSYSREQEAEADARGVRLLHAAAIDPAGLAEFFALLQKEGQGELPEVLSWMGSHPQHQERIESVGALIRGLPSRSYQPLGGDWMEIRRRCGLAPAVEGVAAPATGTVPVPAGQPAGTRP